MDEKVKSAEAHMLTAANETQSYLNETAKEAKATEMIEERMKSMEGELYKLVEENLNAMDGEIETMDEKITEKNEQDGVSWIVADGQTKKLEQAFRDDSEGDIHSGTIQRISKFDQRVGVLEKSVGKAAYYLLPMVDALFESLDFTSTLITVDRMSLAALECPPGRPYWVSAYSLFSLDNNLLMASDCGDQKEVRDLLLDGANVNVKSAQGYTPLHLAAKNGHLNVLNILLEFGADVHGGQTKGITPLHWAAIESSPPCVASLIRAGADVDRKTDNDWTALHFACVIGYEDVVQLLLKAGADRSAKNSYGETPFDLAMSEGVKNILINTECGFSLHSCMLGVFSGL